MINISTSVFFSLRSCRMYINHYSQTMRGILKRKFSEVDDNPCYSSSSSSSPSSLSSPASSEWESDGESSFSDNQEFTPHSPSSTTSLPSKSPNQWPLCFFFFLFQIMQTSSCIWQFSHHRFIGVSLISLQQCWYENVNLRAVLDNTQRMTRLWTVYFVGWKIICLCNRMLWNQFE